MTKKKDPRTFHKVGDEFEISGHIINLFMNANADLSMAEKLYGMANEAHLRGVRENQQAWSMVVQDHRHSTDTLLQFNGGRIRVIPCKAGPDAEQAELEMTELRLRIAFLKHQIEVSEAIGGKK